MQIASSLLLAIAASALLLAAAPEWVGNKACQACHREIFDAYSQTPMALSSGPVDSGLLAESFAHADFTHSHSGYRYRIARTNGPYTMHLESTRAELPIRTQRTLSVFIGSGSIARSFLFQLEGFLFQAPVAYYAQKATWDLAPGYDRYAQPFLTRPILPACLECHASQIQHQPLTQNAYGPLPFLENGVACERCHGPGRAHLAAINSGSKTAASLIVNPAKLPPEQRDSICAQCHLNGEVRVLRAGRTPNSYVAGDRLSDHWAIFARSAASREVKVTSHMENLAQSACKQTSGAQLWCVTCHDPHRVPAANSKVAWFRQKCLACHDQQKCQAPPALRAAKGDDCTACHMPKSGVSDAQHVVYTNHAIPRRPGTPQPTANNRLRGMAIAPGNPRDLALAYAILAQRDNKPSDKTQALKLLSAAESTSPLDAEALLYLAGLYQQTGNSARAIALYERAIQLHPAQLTASVQLGAIRMQQGNYPAAIRLWKDALTKNPALPLVRGNLAIALWKVGDRTAAQEMLKKAAEWQPAFVPPPLP